jgi:SAM-dependent methyltransferase
MASPGSASLRVPDYWWYRSRSRLLRRAIGSFAVAGRAVDVGSADGPSVPWLSAIPLDRDPSGLRTGICADALHLPFRASSLDGVYAFDVIEHFPDDAVILAELRRVLRRGGRLLVAVPAYQWAWSQFDVTAGHYRRYSKRRIVEAVRRAGFSVDRATYAFAATFPIFALARLTGGGRVGSIPRWLDRLLTGLSRIDEVLLARMDLPFGSSVFLAASAE